MTDYQGELEPASSPAAIVPQGGVFALSEVLPIIRQAAEEMREKRIEWGEARERAAKTKAHAKKTRADLIIHLRVWGTADTGQHPIKTSAERNEWADADAEVQQAELDAELAQSVAMVVKAALDEKTAYFNTLQSMLGIERDSFKFERGGQ